MTLKIKPSSVSLNFFGDIKAGDLCFEERKDGTIAYYVQATYLTGGRVVTGVAIEISPLDPVAVSAAKGELLKGYVVQDPKSKRPVLVGQNRRVLCELSARDLNF